MMVSNNIKKVLAILVAFALVGGVPIMAGPKKNKKKNKTELVKKEESKYEKLFKDKKVKTAKGFMTLHLADDGKLIFELPKTMLDKEMLLSSSIEQSSDGGNGIVGYMIPKAIHAYFTATDSLVLLHEVAEEKYISSDSLILGALEKSHSGAVIATFPIETFSPDSLSYVFDATSFFGSQQKKLDPLDPSGANMYEGLIRKDLEKESSTSMLERVEAFKENVSIFSLDTYKVKSYVLGMSSSGDEKLTVRLQRTFYLLPEDKMSPRIADSRIGITTVHFTGLDASDRGAKRVDYAKRWRLSPDKPLVFYIDTLFDDKMAKTISEGVLKWNEAFEAIGLKDCIDVMPYPKDTAIFNANNLQFVCIKMENAANKSVRSSTWSDPRTGEILSAAIYVPYNYLSESYAELFMDLASALPELRTSAVKSPIVYDYLMADITRNVGLCLGLDYNLAGSFAVPCDSLHSASFTQKYGLSASIMDVLPANYLATEEDVQKGVRLIHTNLGEYDKYAIKWLYESIPEAKTPQEEVPYLKSLIAESRKNPLCLYVRPQKALRLDPRVSTGDLGDDCTKSVPQRFENMKTTIANMDKWLADDYDYSFRIKQNGRIYMGFGYSCLDLLKNVGGLYLSEVEDVDGLPKYEVVPKDIQRRSLEMALEISDDTGWLDNRKAYKDIFFVQSFSGYLTSNILLEAIIGSIAKLKFTSTKMDNPYLPSEAYDDIYNHVLKGVRSGKKVSYSNLIMQYMLLGYTLSTSGVITPKGASSSLAASAISGGDNMISRIILRHDDHMASDALVKERYGFEPIRSINFYVPELDESVMYSRLINLKKIYEEASRKTADNELKKHYKFFLYAIAQAMKIE